MIKKQEIDWQLWNFQDIQQEISSKITSVNSGQMPSTVPMIVPLLVSGQHWADIGGGRFNNVKDLFSTYNTTLHIYDPFNRSPEENLATVHAISNKQCDGVMINNVLNVISQPENRLHVIKQAFDCLKDNGLAYFKIYEGNRSGLSKKLVKGVNTSLQLNQKTSFYLDEIKSVFGNELKITKELILVKKQSLLKKTLSVNDEIEQLIAASKALGIPQRSKKYGVGKMMGNTLYLHKVSIHLLPENYKKAFQLLQEHAPTFEFNLVKYNYENNAVSFINSPDFDSSPEPVVGDIIHVSEDGKLKFIKQKKDSQIYHHKWNFVTADYTSFDVKESIQRSIHWKSIVGKNKEISSRIGTQSYWNNLINNNFSLTSQKNKL